MPHTINSSHGQLVIDGSGAILERLTDDNELSNITRFDVTEWREYWGKELDDCIDILDVGYWYQDKEIERYEEPANDWRLEIKQGLLEAVRLIKCPNCGNAVPYEWNASGMLRCVACHTLFEVSGAKAI